MHKVTYEYDVKFDRIEPYKDKATIHLLNEKAPYEAIITARGHEYHIIYGKYQYGFYLALPSWRIACAMADYRDVFWNRGSLQQTDLDKDAVEAIVLGVRNLKNALDTNITEYKQLDFGDV
jgi:hypothetical protein